MKRPVFRATLPGLIMLSAILASFADAGAMANGITRPGTSMTPSSPSDIYVEGKYDRNGMYVPPHFIPKPKPAFSAFSHRDTSKHGYFDLKKPDQPPP